MWKWLKFWDASSNNNSAIKSNQINQRTATRGRSKCSSNDNKGLIYWYSKYRVLNCMCTQTNCMFCWWMFCSDLLRMIALYLTTGANMVEGAGFKWRFGVFLWFLPRRVQRMSGSKANWNGEGGEEHTRERRTNYKEEKTNMKTNMDVIFFRLQWLWMLCFVWLQEFMCKNRWDKREID